MPIIRYLKTPKFWILVLALLTITTSGLAYYFFNQYREITNNPKISNLIEVQKAIQSLKNQIQLPDEEPSAYTITDPTKFKDQAILSKSLTGDIFLVYNQAHKGILYRPSEEKIVEVGTINLQSSSTSTVSIK